MLKSIGAVVAVAVVLSCTEGYGATKGLDRYESPIIVLPAIEWAEGDGTSPKEQAYFHGVLETYAFILYGVAPRTPRHEQEFSDFRQCIEDSRDRVWQLGWSLGKYLETSAAAQLIRGSIPFVCQEYVGKGNGGWKPPRIVSREDWSSFSDEERRFYVSAYVEAVAELDVLMEQKDDLTLLDNCLKRIGVEGILEALEQIEVEWEHPMPWTVSRALGQACSVH